MSNDFSVTLGYVCERRVRNNNGYKKGAKYDMPRMAFQDMLVLSS